MCYRISSLLFFWIHTLESKQLRYLHLVVIWCTFGLIFHKCPVLAMKSQISTLWFNSTLHKLSPIFLMVVILYMVLHFLMCGSIENLDKLEIFTTFSPTVVILYLVPHFSMCTSVEYRDKLVIFTTISPSFPRLSFFT